MEKVNKDRKWLGIGMLALLLSLSFCAGAASGIAYERGQCQTEQLAKVTVKFDEATHALLISAHAPGY